METPAPNTRVTDILRGMAVVAGLVGRKRTDIAVAIVTAVAWALQATAIVMVSAARDEERSFGERPALTPAESHDSLADTLDRIIEAYDARPKA